MAKRKRRIKHAEVVNLFAARLKELRISRGLTQAELARQAHITTSYVWRLESAGAAPSIDLVGRLAIALGTTMTDLLPTTPSPDTLPILQDRARGLFDTLMQRADREALLMLNPLLARLVESLSRKA
jgi:transcriptional regulator with XRE-family HTH domain